MLPDHIELEIVTPERHVQTARVVSVEFPGKEGYMGVLPGHAPLLTELGIGTLVYREGAELHYAAVINGYAEVLPGRVIVLADVCERAEEVDVERARAALERAKGVLGKKPSPDDWDRANFALNRALTRLYTASKGGASSASDASH
ncbi:MAG: F0F1 ATP synthase subunit epsilon [Candidatus Acidiferrales bacterium]